LETPFSEIIDSTKQAPRLIYHHDKNILRSVQINNVTPQTILQRNPSIFASQVDDELVMLDDAQGLYFGLNPVGRKIWELLDLPRSYDALLQSLAQTYDVDLEQCNADVRPFLGQLIEHRLVQISA
jgi:hypothetical protein